MNTISGYTDYSEKTGAADILKKSAMFFAPLIVLVIIAATLVYLVDYRTESNLIEHKQSHAVHMQKNHIINTLETVSSDLVYLAGKRSISGVFTQDGKVDQNGAHTVKNELQLFSESHKNYNRVVLLDNNGREILSVEPQNETEDTSLSAIRSEKTQKDCFENTFNLARGEVYISTFVNDSAYLSGNKVTPVLKFSTPVFDKYSEKRGIVIISYLGKSLFEGFAKVAGSERIRSMMVDSKGYWLQSPSEKDEWGLFQKERMNRTFGMEYPQVWQRILKTENQQFKSKEGIFAIATIYPLIESQNSGVFTDPSESFEKLADSDRNFYWKIVSQVPAKIISQLRMKSLRQSMKYLVIMLLVAGVGSCSLAWASLSRQQTEERIRHNLDFLQLLIDTIPNPVYYQDANGVFRGCNNAFVEFTGIDKDQIVNHTIYDIVSSDMASAYREDDRKLLEQGGKKTYEAKFKHADGTKHDVVFNKALYTHNRENNGIVGIIADITDRKKTERELKTLNEILESQNQTLAESRSAALKLMEQARKAKAETEQINKQLEASIERANMLAENAKLANRAKSDFLANMSHEIRTPLNAIIGYCELMFKDELSGKQREHLHTIREAGKALLELINDILDFSKIEAGKLDVEIIPSSLEELLSSINIIMIQAAENKKLDFRIRQLTRLPRRIKTDPTRLRQCLMNLANNAIKFTENGHVHINLSLEENKESKTLYLAVEDTGIGIPDDKKKIIFDSFSQAENSTTRKFGGTGLGLAITKQLSNMLGGDVSVQSKLEEGSVFTLKIPVGLTDDEAQYVDKLDFDAEIEEQYNVKDEKQQSFTGKVLVADDNEANQMLVKLLLEELGVESKIANNGVEASDMAIAEDFDMVLMDIQMPEMSGYDATRKIRDKGLGVPVVALTANAMKGDAEKCLAAGCDDYLSKPLNEKELIKMLAKYLKSENVQTAAENTDNEEIPQEESDDQAPAQQQAEQQSETAENQPAAEEETLTEQAQSQQDGCEAETAEQEDPAALNIEITEEATVTPLDENPRLKPVVDIFTKQLPQMVQELNDACEKADNEVLKSIAHKMKGASGSAGYSILSDYAAKIEDLAKESRIEILENSIQQIIKLCDKIVEKRNAAG